MKRFTAPSRVLVVDDSEVVRDLVANVLQDAGFEVHEAIHGQQALDLLDEIRPDMVITDVEMPVMNGFSLLREIRVRSRRLPVLLLTTRESAEDRRHAVELGANAHLIKSTFEDEVLLETVRRLMEAA